ncbi:MAG: DNA-processing protein DprA [Clostridiales Family XIII bacterium]|jgi:DNA processing protein|nr:DNA-processing protein DprA [Clostridiales Family XIII bacterium]
MATYQHVDIDDIRYPELLRRIPNAPARLYYRGDVSLLMTSAVAVVGARKATEYGVNVSYNLAKSLAEHGLTVVSGMAEGIDAWAHKGALAADGKTVAVLGCGVDICYPKAHLRLMDDISRYGLIVSELEPGMHATRFTFPMRNRIISGLCLATVVVEAGIKSGSLITAERAAEQGRHVYAVPGNINKASSLGCNRLIQDGAMAIATLDDVAMDLGATNDTVAEIRSAQLGIDEKKVYEALVYNGEMTADELCSVTGIKAQYINGLITVLEMKGLAGTSMGRVFVPR